MSKISVLLSERIKANILTALLKKEISFSELLNVAEVSDNGRLNYHLKILLEEGLLIKKKGLYSLTPLGERMGVYINQFQSKEIYPLPIVGALIYTIDKKLLLVQRAKNPQKGKWGFPGGKVVIGEKIHEAIEREVLEETGLKLKSKKILGFFPSIIYQEEELKYHVHLIPVLMEPISKKDTIVLGSEHLSYRFCNSSDIATLPMIVNNKEIIDCINSGIYFREIICNE